MGSPLFTLPRPDEQQEARFSVRHKCAAGQALNPFLDEADLLEFPVGVYGADMPSNTPFVVVSAEECPACGKWVQAWFSWAAPRIWLP